MIDYKTLAGKLREILKGYKRVTILMHKRPDGDTLGSSLALFESLKSEGYLCEVACIDKDLPIKYKFLESFSKIKHKIDFEDSLIVTLDAADIKRVGFDIEGREIVNIDHHKSNTNYGKLNIVELEVATAVVLYKLLKEGFFIDKSIATALYAALISDSQNFTTSLTNKNTFILASSLIEYGVDITKVSNYVNRYNSLSHLRAKERAIRNLELKIDAKLAITYLDEDDFKASGAKVSDIDGIIDEFIALAIVEVAVLITDFEGLVKVSMRSKNVDISKLALFFGGGGHKNAAGFEAKDSKISLIKKDLIKKVKDIL